MYGVGDHGQKVLPKMIKKIIKKENFSLDNNFAFVDFVNINDAISGLVGALLSNHSGTINIGNGSGYFLKDIKNFIELFCVDEKEAISKIQSYKVSEYGPVLDITRAVKLLQYNPSSSIERTLCEMMKSSLEMSLK